ncbi:ATP-grasp domain-containing protein [Corynebacterium breve]|uniref:ATP-grasp domain-containing protein n=1 Tax=Corynebacterium breve TaxID=3049799 RepID=A0ABY8VG24_9CORY|nr:ATP-grasp domain-containing protein [Corynebacterium breve]WIM67174.1 ATP-grasp domain-containing protein [Corynebacterium breve]
MLKLWLIYDAERKARNQWLIDHYRELGPRFGFEIDLVMAEDPLPVEAPCAAIVRCVAPSLREQLERRGIQSFNSAELARIANDKWLTYNYLREQGVQVMPTALASEHHFDFPFVQKPRDGHGGTGVRLVSAPGEGSSSSALIVQELCDTPGVDLRVYLLGGEILATMLRTSDRDFRSNFSLGGKAEHYCLSTTERAHIKTVIESAPLLATGLIGVDFISHDGAWVVNEIEDVVGARMLYQHTDIDIVEKHLAFIAQAV